MTVEQVVGEQQPTEVTVIERTRELEMIRAAVAAGRDLLLEGPPGTSKTTLLRAVTQSWGIPLVLVEGNPDLTPARLVGHHNPARVLREDYTEDNFVEGPLVQAMRLGGFLYIEEFNRAPDDTMNVLLTAMAERQITIPRSGTKFAAPSFRVVGSMNPFDNVGTTRLSASIRDRMCRLALDYQDAGAESQIVRLRAASHDDGTAVFDEIIADAVGVTRATREHSDIRQGSSVRGAIDTALVASELSRSRRIDLPGSTAYSEMMLDALLLALSGRIHVDEASDVTPEEILRQIWEARLASRLRRDHPG